MLDSLEDAGACFIVREHAKHSRLAQQGEWRACGRVETGLVREQVITAEHHQAPLSASLTSLHGIASRWRRIELALDRPPEDGDTTLWLWSNLPEAVTAGRIAELYRTRWQIEGMFGRLESVLHSELRSLGHPRAALLGFAAAVLACNVLALLQRAVERAHQPPPAPPSPVLPPPRRADQGRLRGPAHRLAARTLAVLERGRPGRLGPAPAPPGPQHQPAPGRN